MLGPIDDIVRYTRIVRAEDGSSRFEDAELPLAEQQAMRTPPMIAWLLAPAPKVLGWHGQRWH
jgi:hypothetical protein